MIHWVLRLSLLGLNVLESFKTIKPAKPRRGGTEPSARALTARKREMKGMLCVWIVSACWISAERICDRTVIYLMPFYNEIKTFSLLFLIISRSAGAEPILLKFIRPLVRPYTDTIDAFLDFLGIFSAFLLELVASPWHAILDRWNTFRSMAAQIPEQDGNATNPPRSRRISIFPFWGENDHQSTPAATRLDEQTLDAPRKPRTQPTSTNNQRRRPARRQSKEDDSDEDDTPPATGDTDGNFRMNIRQNRTVKARAEEVIRQANEVYDEINDAQETVRERNQERKQLEMAGRTRAVVSQAPSEASTTRAPTRYPPGRKQSFQRNTTAEPVNGPRPFVPQAGRAGPAVPPKNDANTRLVVKRAGSSSNEHTSSRTNPQGKVPTKSTDSETGSGSPFTYVPAPPPDVEAQTPDSATYPPRSAADDALANINVDAYFDGARRGGNRGSRPPSNEMSVTGQSTASVRQGNSRRRPNPLQAASPDVHMDIEIDSSDDERPVSPSHFPPPSPPSQYLAPRASNDHLDQAATETPAGLKSPMAPGGFAWRNSIAKSEADDEEVGPDDSISMRGAPRPGNRQAPSLLKNAVSNLAGIPSGLFPGSSGYDTRPTTVGDFDQLKKQLEEEDGGVYASAFESMNAANAGPSVNRVLAPMTPNPDLPGQFPVTPNSAKAQAESPTKPVSAAGSRSSHRTPRGSPQKDTFQPPIINTAVQPPMKARAGTASTKVFNLPLDDGALVTDIAVDEAPLKSPDSDELKRLVAEALAAGSPVQMPLPSAPPTPIPRTGPPAPPRRPSISEQAKRAEPPIRPFVPSTDMLRAQQPQAPSAPSRQVPLGRPRPHQAPSSFNYASGRSSAEYERRPAPTPSVQSAVPLEPTRPVERRTRPEVPSRESGNSGRSGGATSPPTVVPKPRELATKRSNLERPPNRPTGATSASGSSEASTTNGRVTRSTTSSARRAAEATGGWSEFGEQAAGGGFMDLPRSATVDDARRRPRPTATPMTSDPDPAPVRRPRPGMQPRAASGSSASDAGTTTNTATGLRTRRLR